MIEAVEVKFRWSWQQALVNYSVRRAFRNGRLYSGSDVNCGSNVYPTLKEAKAARSAELRDEKARAKKTHRNGW